MKFAEAALFWLATSPSGRVRSEIRQGRADASFVRGVWLGETTESDEHLVATDTGVCTTRTVKRVPDTEQRRADLVKSLQGPPWDRLAGRPAGRPRKTVFMHRPLRHFQQPKQVSDRAKIRLESALQDTGGTTRCQR